MSDLEGRIAGLSDAQRALLQKRLARKRTDGQDFRRRDAGSVEAAPAPLGRSARRGGRSVQLGMLFFSADESVSQLGKYAGVIELARAADDLGFASVWTPERHFYRFGGLYPNPSVLGAALARETRHVAIRAGSVVLPLHHPVRVAEEWSVVDNLSGGRVGVAVAPGFNPLDFSLASESYAERRSVLRRKLGELRALWRGEAMSVPDGQGGSAEVRVFPRPVQDRLPIWLTTTGKPESFLEAAELDTHVLTGLMDLTVDELAERIALYRNRRAELGLDPELGIVSVMAHTYVGDGTGRASERVRGPFIEYLKTHYQLTRPLAKMFQIDVEKLSSTDLDALFEFSFERYLSRHSVIGEPDVCEERLWRLAEAGVDELACLADFGLDTREVLASMARIVTLPPARRSARADQDSATLAREAEL